MKYNVEHEHTVEVWGKRHTIGVYQTSKSVWIAVGDYMGKPIEVKDRSKGAVIKRWGEAARSRGNL
jgi:hypothetical protein